MKVRVEFTINIGNVEALKAAANTEDLSDARKFVSWEAEDYILNYLDDHGAKPTRVATRGNTC